MFRARHAYSRVGIIEVCKSLIVYIKAHVDNAGPYICGFCWGYSTYVYGEIEASDFKGAFAGNADYAWLAAERAARRKQTFSRYLKKAVKAFMPYVLVRILTGR